MLTFCLTQTVVFSLGKMKNVCSADMSIMRCCWLKEENMVCYIHIY
jgi:hypothetical protein